MSSSTCLICFEVYTEGSRCPKLLLKININAANSFFVNKTKIVQIRNFFSFQKMSSSACPICFEIYTEGNRCPKLLPCTHTIYVLCLRQLVCNSRVQCPECHLHHSVPSGGVQAFPTNRYVLEIMELAQRNAALEGKGKDIRSNQSTERFTPSAPPDDTANEPSIQPGRCDFHNQPFSMFCFEEQCNKMLCHTCFNNSKKSHGQCGPKCKCTAICWICLIIISLCLYVIIEFHPFWTFLTLWYPNHWRIQDFPDGGRCQPQRWKCQPIIWQKCP